jgi:hypothetical protein
VAQPTRSQAAWTYGILIAAAVVIIWTTYNRLQ